MRWCLAGGVATLALLLTPSAATAAGCPLTWEGTPDSPTHLGQDEPLIDSGPLGDRNQRADAVSFTVEGDETLAIGLRVADMQPTTRAGWRWTYWAVSFNVDGGSVSRSRIQVFYDAVRDEFLAFRSTGGVAGYAGAALDVTTGPGGGWVARAPLSAFKVARGGRLSAVEVESGDFLSYTYMNADPADQRTWPSGVYNDRWSLPGPPAVALIGCPAVMLTARDLGNGRGVQLTGDAHPAGSEVRIDVRQPGGDWAPVAQTQSSAAGSFAASAVLPPGERVFRAIATAPDGTVSTSADATATLTD